MQSIIDSVPPGELRDYLTGHLLTVVCHGDVHIDARPDTSRVQKGQGVFQVEMSSDREQATRQRSWISMVTAGSYKDQEDDGEIEEVVIEYEEKTHYRIVFRELGTPLRDLTSFWDIFEALAQVCYGAPFSPSLAFRVR